MLLLLFWLVFSSQADSCSSEQTGGHIPATHIEHSLTSSKCIAWQFRASVVEAQGILCPPSSADSWVSVKVLGVPVGNFTTLRNPSCLPFKLIIANGNFCLTFSDKGVFVHGDLVISGQKHTFGPDLLFPYSVIPGLSPRPGRLLSAMDAPIGPEKALDLAVQFFANQLISNMHSLTINFDESSVGISIKDLSWTQATVGDVTLKIGPTGQFIEITDVTVPVSVNQLTINTVLFGKPEALLLAAVTEISVSGKPIKFYPGCGGSKTGFEGPGISSYKLAFTGTDGVGKLLASILNKPLVQAIVEGQVNSKIPSFVELPPNPIYQVLFCNNHAPLPLLASREHASSRLRAAASSEVTPTQFLKDWLNGMIRNLANTHFKIGDCDSTLDSLNLCGKASTKAQVGLKCDNCAWKCPGCGSVCCGCWRDYLNPACGVCEGVRQTCLGVGKVCDFGCQVTEGLLEADAGLDKVSGLGSLTIQSLELQPNNRWSFVATASLSVSVHAAAATYVSVSPTIPIGSVQVDGQLETTCSGNAVTKGEITAFRFDAPALDVTIRTLTTALNVALTPVTVFVPSLKDKLGDLGNQLTTLMNTEISDQIKSVLQGQIKNNLPLQNAPICS